MNFDLPPGAPEAVTGEDTDPPSAIEDALQFQYILSCAASRDPINEFIVRTGTTCRDLTLSARTSSAENLRRRSSLTPAAKN